MSAEGRKAISEATKKRWAAFHAASQAEKPERAEPAKAKSKEAASKMAAAVEAPSAKAANKTAPAKKAVANKTARAAAQPATEAEGQ
jgi:hypothetical protein